MIKLNKKGDEYHKYSPPRVHMDTLSNSNFRVSQKLIKIK